jgi:hypothetical protein
MASPLLLRIQDSKYRLRRRKFHTLLECSMNASRRPDKISGNVRRTIASPSALANQALPEDRPIASTAGGRVASYRLARRGCAPGFSQALQFGIA